MVAPDSRALGDGLAVGERSFSTATRKISTAADLSNEVFRLAQFRFIDETPAKYRITWDGGALGPK